MSSSRLDSEDHRAFYPHLLTGDAQILEKKKLQPFTTEVAKSGAFLLKVGCDDLPGFRCFQTQNKIRSDLLHIPKVEGPAAAPGFR